MADLNAIFSSSKLFRSFSVTRRKAIIEAAQDPLNTELVQQLVEYLDPEYQTEEYLVTPEEKVKTEEEKQLENSEEDTDEIARNFDELSNLEFSGGPSYSHFSEDNDNDLDEHELDDNTEGELDGESPPVPPPSQVEEVTEATDIDTDEISISKIKDILEANEKTAGVSRVIVKGDELWIYYVDKLNLNNVMGPVVECISEHGMDRLDFNRLARSDNAIVFEISK